MPWDVLHVRLGHPGSAAEKALGIQPRVHTCEVCPFGKLVLARTSKTAVPLPAACGDAVHSDIFGPFRATLGNQFRYVAAFVDAHSRKAFLFPMKRKSEYLDCFKQLQTAFAEDGYTIKRLHTDSDSVMMSAEMAQYAASQSPPVRLTFSAPYSHWQNGTAERYAYTCKNRTICALQQSGLGEEWWLAAMHFATYTYNITPTRATANGVSPFPVHTYACMFDCFNDSLQLEEFFCASSIPPNL
mgnify:CR=1 FL=1